jgi:glutaryl-CoA dehydrogenase
MGFDYLDLESELTEEERAVRDTAREFADDRVRPIIDDHYHRMEFPKQLIPEMGELGFFYPTCEEYGLPGITATAWGLLQMELAAADSGVRSMVNGQGYLVMYPIHRYGSEAQKDEWLPRLATGEAVGCYGLTEPDHGSNPAGMESYAEREGDEYVLEGEKTWITSAPMADVVIIWARDRSIEDDPVRGFLVPTDTDGVTVTEIDEKLSMRCSPVGRVELDRVRLPEMAVLPGTDGLSSALSCTTEARFGIAWSTAGVARDCFESARDYATEREQFDRPIASFQLQQEKLAEMATKVTNAQLLAYRLSRLKEDGDLRPEQASMGKRNNTRTARQVARTAREMLGGNGITTDYPPMRHLSNIESVYTYEGTFDMHSLILGHDLTGIPAFT